MTEISSRIILVCWAIFLLVWLVRAFSNKPIAERQGRLSALAHRLPIGFGWWLLAYPRFPAPLKWQVLPHVALLQIMGAAITVYGLVFTLWARRTLAGNWSSDVTFKRDHELIRLGPYRFVRHPIYTGLLVMCLGTALQIGQLRGGLSVLLVTTGFWIKLNQEERLLLEHFPEGYPAYQKQVKALIPFLL